jgi:hypothetical protein
VDRLLRKAITVGSPKAQLSGAEPQSAKRIGDNAFYLQVDHDAFDFFAFSSSVPCFRLMVEGRRVACQKTRQPKRLSYNEACYKSKVNYTAVPMRVESTNSSV